MKPILLILLLIPILAFLPFAKADTQYWIVITPSNWLNQLIPVNVPSSPQILHDDVLQAMSIWNQAQKWFQATYYPTGAVYTFLESSGGNGITIHSSDLQTLQRICAGSQAIVSCIHFLYSSDSGQIVNAQIFLLSSFFSTNNTRHMYLALSMFGAALSLDQ